MYSYEDRIRAVHLYISLGKRGAATVRQLGYPTTKALTIACGSEVIARHRRSYEREAVVFDPLHYLALLGCSSRRRVHWIKAPRSPVGSCRSASRSCGACSKQGSRSTAAGSMCKCCDSSRPSTSQKSLLPSKMPCA